MRAIIPSPARLGIIIARLGCAGEKILKLEILNISEIRKSHLEIYN